jgi:hypothetical protein
VQVFGVTVDELFAMLFKAGGWYTEFLVVCFTGIDACCCSRKHPSLVAAGGQINAASAFIN